MNYLGIDYGRKKIGLAIGDFRSEFCEPYVVLRVNNEKDAVDKINKVVKEEKVMKVILGISEGLMAEEQQEFGKKLQTKLKIEVILQDETLSTREAQTKSLEAGLGRKKRKDMEDAFAATIILQSYLDNL
jgi:putative Holliday junction resolvase